MRKTSQQRTKSFRRREVLELFHESAAGLALSGDSGTGKSNAMLVLMQALARDVGLTLIDPHGDLAEEFERSCAAMPRRLRDRCLVIRPSELSRVVAINPLHVPEEGASKLRWRAQVAAKTSVVGRVIINANGDTNFKGMPVLQKWTTRTFSTCAEHHLTIPDSRHFFDVGGDVYDALIKATPEVIARTEMTDLAGMRPRDREDIIASTKNRILGFLENPVVALTLGRPSGWLDMRELIRNRSITIISLERGGVLRDEDVEIFANLWLSELLFAAYNLPRHQRTPHVVFLDELPVFASSFDLLTRALAQVRKFQIRVVAAFQGTQLFPERTEDRLLNAFISQCRTTIVLRHKNPVDAKFFGELITLPVLDPSAEKHRLTQWQQYQAGNEVVFLNDETTTWSNAEQSGGSRTSAESLTATQSQTESSLAGTSTTETYQNRVLSDAVSRARSEQTGRSVSRAASHGSTQTDGANWSNTATRGGSRTRRMTLVPRLRWREILASVQLFTPDEQITFAASNITQQDTGEAVVYTAGEAPMRVRFPLANDPFGRTPRFAAKQLLLLRNEIASQPIFATPAQIIAERQEFERRLIAHLRQRALESEALAVLPPHETVSNPLLSI